MLQVGFYNFTLFLHKPVGSCRVELHKSVHDARDEADGYGDKTEKEPKQTPDRVHDCPCAAKDKHAERAVIDGRAAKLSYDQEEADLDAARIEKEQKCHCGAHEPEENVLQKNTRARAGKRHAHNSETIIKNAKHCAERAGRKKSERLLRNRYFQCATSDALSGFAI